MEAAVAVMQPYAFPYLGYFGLVQASSTFVFYDDVHYQPRGWINRNRILIGGRDHLFSIPVAGASQNVLIEHVALHEPAAFRRHFLRQLAQSYRHAAQVDAGLAYVDSVLSAGDSTIAGLAMRSVRQACVLLGIERRFLRSSESFAATRGLGRVQRLAAITQAAGASRYVNSVGGQALYRGDEFAQHGVRLEFVVPQLAPYPQGGAADFVPGLSIIDVLMHNDLPAVRRMVAGCARVQAGVPA